MARFFCPLPLHTGDTVSLPPSAARHVQVLRLQPGDGVTLFNGEGGEYAATVTRMGRSDVDVSIGAHTPFEREALCAVHLLAGITANIVTAEVVAESAGEPGKVMLKGETLEIHAGAGALRILTLQPAGKNVMAAREFINGYRQRLLA